VDMNEEKRFLLKVLSALLQYPDEELVLFLDELKEAMVEIFQKEHREKCVNFLDYLDNNLLIRLQEEYTATFDLNPATSLNLTYHKWGNARERGSALSDLNGLYCKAGYDSSDDDLPDYLPLILEFLSISTLTDSFSFLGQYCDHVEAIGSRLREQGSPYAGLFEIVLDVFRDLKAKGD
jgi:nitrate reductase delta subunit